MTIRKQIMLSAGAALSVLALAACNAAADDEAPQATGQENTPQQAAAPATPETQGAVREVTPVVETAQGKVQGFMDNGVEEYLGLRYAAPPTGEHRFQPPRPPESWQGIYDATSFGAPAMQMYSASGTRETDFTRQIQQIFPTAGEAKIDNEDALFLNVWTPGAGDGARPVMVWFHGGGYAYGSGGWPAYDGRNLAEKGDVVVVTVNHRLNAFGYMYLADRFGEDFAESGNLGNLDLIASLEWVKENIAAFGGDPSNVTIMGESGGGMKVSDLLATPAADGLFHKAIIQSGPGVTAVSKEDAIASANAVLDEAGIETVDDLMTIPAEDLMQAAFRAQKKMGGAFSASGLQLRPVADGVVLPGDPFMPAAPEATSDVPLIIGWNKDEMTLFLASQPWFGLLNDAALDGMASMFGEEGPALVANYRELLGEDATATDVAVRAAGARFIIGSYTIADLKSAQGDAPVYMYRLTYETPVSDGVLKSPHTLEIPFMFDNVEESRVLVGPGEAPVQLGAMMSDAWISFARTGTPSSDLLPDWQPYTSDTRMAMEFNVEPQMVSDPEKGAREIMSGGGE